MPFFSKKIPFTVSKERAFHPRNDFEDLPFSSKTRHFSTTGLSLVENGLMELMGRPFPYMVLPHSIVLLGIKKAD